MPVLLRTTDLVSPEDIRPGDPRHCYLIDLVDAVQSGEDAELVSLIYQGRSQADVANIIGVVQSTVSRRLASIFRRAR